MGMTKSTAAIIGGSLIAGLAIFGFLLGDAAIKFRELDRTVTVKGLAEREVTADVVIWPIQFTTASNDVAALYDSIEDNFRKIGVFLTKQGIQPSEITVSTPAITDKSAQAYGSNGRAEFRYTAKQTVTVYSENIPTVQSAMRACRRLANRESSSAATTIRRQPNICLRDSTT